MTRFFTLQVWREERRSKEGEKSEKKIGRSKEREREERRQEVPTIGRPDGQKAATWSV